MKKTTITLCTLIPLSLQAEFLDFNFKFPNTIFYEGQPFSVNGSAYIVGADYGDTIRSLGFSFSTEGAIQTAGGSSFATFQFVDNGSFGYAFQGSGAFENYEYGLVGYTPVWVGGAWGHWEYYPNYGTYSTGVYSGSETATGTFTVLNLAPTITSITTDLSITEGSAFNFSATATDPGLSDVLSFLWDFDGDGIFDRTGNSGAVVFNEPGEYRGRLQVIDDDGGASFSSFNYTIQENPEPPVLEEPEVQPVPEVQTYAMWVGAALAGLEIVRRKRRGV